MKKAIQRSLKNVRETKNVQKKFRFYRRGKETASKQKPPLSAPPRRCWEVAPASRGVPGRWVWRIPARQSAVGHRKGRRRGRCVCREAAGSDSRRPPSFLNKRGRRDWMREWAGRRPHKTPPHSPATAPRRDLWFDTWDTLCVGSPRGGCPSCGSRERVRTGGTPTAASRLACPCAAWREKPACWSPRDTVDGLRWSPALVPPGVWGWECVTDLQPCATARSHHRGRWESHQQAPESQSPPKIHRDTEIIDTGPVFTLNSSSYIPYHTWQGKHTQGNMRGPLRNIKKT